MNNHSPAIIITLSFILCFCSFFVGFRLGIVKEREAAAKAGVGAYVIESPEKPAGVWIYHGNSNHWENF